MSSLPMIPGNLGAHALAYAELGYEVFPLNADKTPKTPNGMKDATSDPAIVAGYWELWPDALIGCRIPPGFILIDVDPKHRGMDTWLALKAAYGDPPLTRVHASGRGDGGGHLWFRRPEGTLSARGLNRWAREHGTGEPAGKHSWISGIDLLHYGHRYTILPPSPHPLTGKAYQWVEGRGLDVEPASLPLWLAALLVEAPAVGPVVPGPKLGLVDFDSIADWFSASTSFADLLIPEGWILVSGTGDSDGSRWRHPNASQPYSATVKHGCLFVYSTSTDFEPTAEGDPHGYTPFRVFATLAHGGDLRAAGRAARILKDGAPPSRDDFDWVTLTSGCGQTAVRGPQTAVEVEEVIPSPSWPELSPAALHGPLGLVVDALAPHTEADRAGILAALLAYFGAAVGAGPHFRLSGTRQGARVNLLVVGESARARKGSAEGMARWVMRTVDAAVAAERRMNGLNSGEGLIEAVRDPRWGRDKHGNEVLLDEGVSDKRLFLYEPEFAGRLLPAIKRQGSTISGLLRMAWDEGDLQTMNVRNPLRATGAHLCVLGNTTITELLAGISPADIESGLLNRFLFVAVRSTRRLPFGGDITDTEVEALGKPLRAALEASRRRSRLDFAESTRRAWTATYDALMDDAPDGPLGHLTARGPIQVQRLALVYALADSAAAIEAAHLDAALAVWAFCRASAELVLATDGRLTGDPDGDRMLRFLIDRGEPMTVGELRLALGNWGGARTATVRARLERSGLVAVRQVPRPGGGRPTTWVEAR